MTPPRDPDDLLGDDDDDDSYLGELDSERILRFEDWVDMAPQLGLLDRRARAAMLEARGIDEEDWNTTEVFWVRSLADDLDRGMTDRIALYAARCVEVRARAAAASPAGEAHGAQGEARALRPAAPPPVRPGQDETIEGVGMVMGDGLPFGETRSPEFQAELEAAPRGDIQRPQGRDETVLLGAEAAAPADPLPFAADASKLPREWSIERYADLCGDLVADPSRAAEVLAEHGVSDPALRQSLDRTFRARMRADDDLRMRFEARFRERRAQRRQRS